MKHIPCQNTSREEARLERKRISKKLRFHDSVGNILHSYGTQPKKITMNDQSHQVDEEFMPATDSYAISNEYSDNNANAGVPAENKATMIENPYAIPNGYNPYDYCNYCVFPWPYYNYQAQNAQPQMIPAQPSYTMGVNNPRAR